MKNLDGSLKNLFVLTYLRKLTVLYSNEYRTSGLF